MLRSNGGQFSGQSGYCRGNHANHNDPRWYTKVPWSQGSSLALCQQQCANNPNCKGIEYAHGTVVQNHCELWNFVPRSINQKHNGVQTAVCYVINRSPLT